MCDSEYNCAGVLCCCCCSLLLHPAASPRCCTVILQFGSWFCTLLLPVPPQAFAHCCCILHLHPTFAACCKGLQLSPDVETYCSTLLLHFAPYYCILLLHPGIILQATIDAPCCCCSSLLIHTAASLQLHPTSAVRLVGAFAVTINFAFDLPPTPPICWTCYWVRVYLLR